MDGTDELGIRWLGPVVAGKRGAELRRELEVDGLLARPDDDGECYEDAGDYDPVLRWHCRLEGRPPVL